MDDFRSFLVDILKNPELEGNKFAWTIASYPNINMATRETFYESLRPFYPSNEDHLPVISISEKEENIDKDEFENKDYRIKQNNIIGH